MGKRWLALCFAGCFGVVLGVVGMGAEDAYAKGGKKLAAEGAVFDFKAHTSASISIYGNVSDKGRRPVEGAVVSLRDGRRETARGESGPDGGYWIEGLQPNTKYTVFAEKRGMGKTRSVKFKTDRDEFGSYIINFQFKKPQER